MLNACVFFLGLYFITLCAQINVIGRNQIPEILVLARFGLSSLAKYIQQREAEVPLHHVPPLPLIAKFE